jgi:hypothetical protein
MAAKTRELRVVLQRYYRFKFAGQDLMKNQIKDAAIKAINENYNAYTRLMVTSQQPLPSLNVITVCSIHYHKLWCLQAQTIWLNVAGQHDKSW